VTHLARVALLLSLDRDANAGALSELFQVSSVNRIGNEMLNHSGDYLVCLARKVPYRP
jgi:hypothetical protein